MTFEPVDTPTAADLRDEHEATRAVLAAALAIDGGVWDHTALPVLARHAAERMNNLREIAAQQAATISQAKETTAACLEGIGDRDADDATGTLSDLLDEATTRLEQLHQLAYTDMLKNRAMLITQIITGIYNRINQADSINVYGDITRRAALAAVIDEAGRRGVTL